MIICRSWSVTLVNVDASLLRSHLHMAFPERDRWRAAAARKERVWGEKILTEGEGEGLQRSPQTLSFLAGDLAPEMPYGDDCGGGYVDA